MKPYRKGIINSKIEILKSLLTMLKHTTKKLFDHYEIKGLCDLNEQLRLSKIFSKGQYYTIKSYFDKYLPRSTALFSWKARKYKPRRRWLKKRITIEILKITWLILYYNFWLVIINFIILCIFVYNIVLLKYLNLLWIILLVPMLLTILMFLIVFIRTNIRL